jgi:VIT1/CCC1 family predicted Fe2+/Mn2+ transporter
MGCLSEQGQGIRALRALRKAPTSVDAHRVIADAVPPVVASAMEPAEYETVRQRMLKMPEPPTRPRLGKNEWIGAVAVFLWVFITTFPVAVPFMVMNELGPAMRVSNALAVSMLFVLGYAFAKVAEYRPLLTGVLMVVLGSAVVAATIALGG